MFILYIMVILREASIRPEVLSVIGMSVALPQHGHIRRHRVNPPRSKYGHYFTMVCKINHIAATAIIYYSNGKQLD